MEKPLILLTQTDRLSIKERAWMDDEQITRSQPQFAA